MKQIRIQTKSPIEIDPATLLEAINELRKECGDKKKDKVPIELSKVLPKINLFQNRDAEKGKLSFTCHMKMRTRYLVGATSQTLDLMSNRKVS